VAEPLYGPEGASIEVMPVVVLSQIFPARPSSIPDIRDFVRRCLAESPLTEEGTARLARRCSARCSTPPGPPDASRWRSASSPEHVEVDVLPLGNADRRTFQQAPPVTGGLARPAIARQPGRRRRPQLRIRSGRPFSPVEAVQLGQPGHPTTFAEWMSSALRREGMTPGSRRAQLGVSVKTVSRWVGGANRAADAGLAADSGSVRRRGPASLAGGPPVSPMPPCPVNSQTCLVRPLDAPPHVSYGSAMAVQAGRHQLGTDRSRIVIRTSRDGMAARLVMT